MTLKFSTSACRYCQYYQPEGRRGGTCQQLGVTVQGSWTCDIAIPAFAPSWEGLKGTLLTTDPVLSDAPLLTSR